MVGQGRLQGNLSQRIRGIREYPHPAAWGMVVGMETSRRLIYGILITVAVGAALGRLFSTQLVLEPSLHRNEQDPNDIRRHWPKVRPAEMPTFSSNDRSRWATVRGAGR